MATATASEEVPVSDVLPKIEIPLPEPNTTEQIGRRRKLFAGVLRLREQLPPTGFHAAELIPQLRDEDEGRNS